VSDQREEPIPLVSVVIPMLNERSRIQHCLDGLEAQAYPIDRIEALVVDGGSTDGSTELVRALQADRPWLRLVNNPDRRASSAFNRGVEAAKGDVIVLLSSHGEVGTDFISRSVAALDETGAGGVGGVLRHEGDDAVSRAIGLAMTSPFGMASPFRYATTRRVVDTIGHPAYRREVLDEVGPFDEGLERNSDYELNYRIRKAGHELVFDPDIVTVYRPRSTLPELARQFWWYGRWKAHVIRRQPGSLQARHLAPPAFVAFVATAPLLARVPAGRLAVAVASVAYAGGLAAAVRAARPHEHQASTAAFVAALPVMHVSWGAGFVATALAGWRR
jgi:succinoglycan biosynthesis protein ExoA